MAYICTSKVPCGQCGHYRWDPDEGRMACFAQQEEAKAVHLESLGDKIRAMYGSGMDRKGGRDA